MVTCYLGVGSNLGDRVKNIESAVKKINCLKNTKVIKLSRIIETQPQGGPPQGKFLNAALKIRTDLSSLNLLKSIKTIEKQLGRIKTVRYGPRPIDLDILFYSNKIINRSNLKVPHPKIREREFVVRSLLEVV